MARYYEEAALIEFVKKNTPTIGGKTTMNCVERAIREAPTADVVPRAELENAKQEADRLAVELEAEKALREVRIERIFEEIEMLMKRHIFPVVREGVIEIEREPFLIIDPQDWAVLKSRYTFGGSSWAPTPTGEVVTAEEETDERNT